MTRLIGQARALLPALPRRLRIWSGDATTERLWLAPRPSGEIADLEDFLAQAPPSAVRNTHYIGVIMFLSIILIASLVKVDVVVTGSGRLVADAPTVVVQPMQLSIIREIRVKAGDTVSRGEVLATLDPTFTQADWTALAARRSALDAEIARLAAELDGAAYDLSAGGAERQLQATLYRQRQVQYQSRLADFDQKIDGLTADVAVAEQSRASLTQESSVVREVQSMRGSLYESKVGSKLNYLSAQVDRMRTERDLQAATMHLGELQHGLRSTQAERQAFADGWRRDLLEALVNARADDAAVAENLTKARRMNDLVALTAPEDGVVLEVAKRSVGSVLQAAEPLVTLVPLHAPLIADVSISSADVGYARVGDTAVVKVDAFPFQRHGLLSGNLRAIGEDSFASGGSATASAALFHHSQVTLSGQALHHLPEGAKLIPGMTVTAEIEVGSRSVISFFLYPIVRSIRESMREP
jgi:HlyD family secretion protein